MARLLVSIFLLSSLIHFTSCISTKRLTYLQAKKDQKLDSLTIVTQDPIDYKIRKGDNILLTIIDPGSQEYNFLSDISNSNTNIQSPELTGISIDEKGEITIPFIGNIKISGLTVKEAEQKLIDTLSFFLENPSITIKPLNFYVTILGEVGSPGRVISYRKNLTILEALGLSGDLTDYADRRKIQINRFNQDQTVTVYRIDLTDVNNLSSNLLYLQSGDVITVPPMKVKAFKQYNLQNVSLVFSGVSVLAIIISLTR